MQTSYSTSQLEVFAEEYIFPILMKGNPTWDKPHAQAVAYHINKIIEGNPDLGLDPVVMILAAYLHDIGYSRYYKEGLALTKDEYMNAKKTHMEIGVQMARGILNKIKLPEAQRSGILHLISVHDKIEQLATVEELCFMEADTLGGLDVNFSKPTFTQRENLEYMDSLRKRRYPKFITGYGKKEFQILAKARDKYYQNI